MSDDNNPKFDELFPEGLPSFSAPQTAPPPRPPLPTREQQQVSAYRDNAYDRQEVPNFRNDHVARPIRNPLPALEPKQAGISPAVVIGPMRFWRTETGQYVILGLFVLLTVVDVLTNYWAFAGGMQSAMTRPINLLMLVFAVVSGFSESMLSINATLKNRMSVADSRVKKIVLRLFDGAILFVMAADFIATYDPIYKLLVVEGDLMSMALAFVSAIAVALFTTIGSWFLFEQIVICVDLLKQERE